MLVTCKWVNLVWKQFVHIRASSDFVVGDFDIHTWLLGHKSVSLHNAF